jgi:hypothetical protein
MLVNWKDTATGGIFIAIGAWFLFAGYGLERGTVSRMGPGFFSPILAGILILLGAFIALRSIGVRAESIGTVSWRAVLFTCAAPVIFGSTIVGLGLAPSLVLTVFCAALASRHVSVLRAAVVSLSLSAFCVVLFSYGLGLPVQLIGPWLGG